MKINEGKILLLLMGILSGILLITFVLNNPSQVTKVLTYNQYKDMQIEANSLKAENRGLYKRLDELETKLSKYQGGGSKTDEKVNKTIHDELEEIKLFYGITKVTGGGISIILDDNRKDSYSNTLERNNSVVHNVDIYEIVNELRNSGAMAIAVNGYRVVGESRITCEGPIIMIDDNSIVPPFKIDAIGDPNALEYTVNSQENKFGNISMRGLLVDYEKFSKKTLSPCKFEYKGDEFPRYMKEINYNKKI